VPIDWELTVEERSCRELGRHALDLYTQIKSVWVDLN
jgi:hypothetical protein